MQILARGHFQHGHGLFRQHSKFFPALIDTVCLGSLLNFVPVEILTRVHFEHGHGLFREASMCAYSRMGKMELCRTTGSSVKTGKHDVDGRPL